MYSFKNQYPTENLPNRIRLSSGLTRTGGVYTEDELLDAGYKTVSDMPSVAVTQKALWNESIGEWYVIEKSEDDISQENAIAWNEIRKKRNQLLEASDWTQSTDYPGQYALLERRELKQKYVEYRKKLRDIPHTYSDASQVVWPDLPTIDAQ